MKEEHEVLTSLAIKYRGLVKTWLPHLNDLDFS